MKKIFTLFLLLLLFTGCGQKKEEKTNKLIVGFDAEFPPFGYVNENGEYDGFDLALAKELCQRIGYEFECVAIIWEAKDAELASGNINCIWNGFTCTGREDQYTWSDPYVDNTIIVVVKDENIKSLADLSGKNVMVQAASSSADALYSSEIANEVNVIELSDYNLGFVELNQGSVDAVIVDKGVANYQIKKQNETYYILEENISVEQYAIGFLKGNVELMEIVNAELIKMAKDGTMEKIAQNYVDEGIIIESLCLLDNE